jgi:hypothetical protein
MIFDEPIRSANDQVGFDLTDIIGVARSMRTGGKNVDCIQRGVAFAFHIA